MTTTSVVYELGRAPSIDSATTAVLLVALAVTVLPTVRRLVSIDRAALTALAELARRDPLTGLINRRGFESRFSELDLTSVDDLVLTYIDLDHFKQINDTLGHSAGDELLVQVGRRLLQATRADDLVARVGGGEFLVASHGSPTRMAGLAARIRTIVGAEPYLLGASRISITASIGQSPARETPKASSRRCPQRTEPCM